jgi:hypothetical protein
MAVSFRQSAAVYAGRARTIREAGSGRSRL